jgi:DNA-directed RNA polymerase subunit RPC12/RpoP
MADIYHYYRCLHCGYEMSVRVPKNITCPACGKSMSYITSHAK